MIRRFVGVAMVLALGLAVPFAHGEQRGRGEKPGGEKPGGESRNKKEGKPESEPQNRSSSEKKEKPENEIKGGSKPPGGAWSESKKSPSNGTREQEAEGGRKSPKATGAEGAAIANEASKNKSNQPSAKEGAAAGAAATNRNKSEATGAEGATAGAVAVKRNQPAASGAEGVAVGATATKRNQPAASGAEGAAIGAAAVKYNEPAVSGAAGTLAGSAAVRNSFHHPNVYNEQWYADHHGAWSAPRWAAGTVWTATTLAAVSSHCGYANNAPISYGYGSNVVYQQGSIIMDGQNVGTAEEFSQKAADLAQYGQDATTADSDEWLPLGVFALVRDEDQHPQLTIQLAVNRDGIVRGNYNDTVIDHVLQIHGAVDKETQRVAWTVDNNKNFFMEAGLSNLTSGEAPTLIHKSGRTERWLLVRLAQPDEQL